MTTLILGGTTEASRLAARMAEGGLPAILSYAGRTDRPRAQPVPVRVGGFGGLDGLRDWLLVNGIARVVDATHPFAAQISANAIAGCRAAGVPLVALERPAWVAGAGDRWTHVRDVEDAVQALDGPARRVFLAIGRQNLQPFASQPQHHYLLRLVDPPDTPLPLRHHAIEIATGPFDAAGDRALMERHGVEVIVAKNAGGSGAEAKLVAARSLGLPVIMIARPKIPVRQTVTSVDAAMDWVHADLGV